MNSDRPRTERFGYFVTIVRAISPKPMLLRCRTVMSSSTPSSRSSVESSTCPSMSWTSSSASSSLPWMNIHRGLSGT